MVGALADWFAVTALFRHPLGLPIPHTAIIPERKDQFGETLGDFVQSVVPDARDHHRAGADRPGRRAPGGLARPSRPTPSGWPATLADAIVTAADVVDDEDVQRAIEEAVRTRVEAMPLAPLAGRALGVMVEGDRHQQLLDVDAAGARPLPLREPQPPAAPASPSETPVVDARGRRGPPVRAAARGRAPARPRGGHRPRPRAAQGGRRAHAHRWSSSCRPRRSCGPGARS